MNTKQNYGPSAFLPMILFLLLYVGTGIYFTIMGFENPFSYVSRYVAVMISIIFAMVFYERKTSISKKVEIYSQAAGSEGVMLLGLIVLLAGGFSSAAEAMGGQESIVNMGISLIPSSFLIPGIFLITCFISTSIGTSMGTQVAMIPVAIAIAKTAGINPAMAGASVIAGAYFGDNLSFISDTTIAATKGVGAEMKDKFKMNFLIALPAAVITIIIYSFLGAGASQGLHEELNYSIIKVLPYVTVLITALIGFDVSLVLVIGTIMTGVIGLATGSIDLLSWLVAISEGMESMFFLAVFAMLVSGLIGLIRYYGGIEWLVETMTQKIKSKKACEYIISAISMIIAGTTLNNTVAIVITAPIAKELGSKYKIAPRRLSSLLDIFSCAILMLVPHDSGFLLVQEYANVGYLDVVSYAFYPILLILFTIISIQFNLLKTKEEKEVTINE